MRSRPPTCPPVVPLRTLALLALCAGGAGCESGGTGTRADAGAAADAHPDLTIADLSVAPADASRSAPDAASTTLSLAATATTSATGFPTSWYGFALPAAPVSYAGLAGSVSVQNSADIYSEVLFIVGYLPSGTCTQGLWPASTPEYGPPGFIGVTNLIVKAPTTGTFSVPVDFTLPQTVPISNCVLIGLNGGTVSSPHPVTSTSTLALRYQPQKGPAAIVGVGGEFCFGQDWGCQKATTDNTQSFAAVNYISKATQLTALVGDISDSTFDGTKTFGAPPAGAWTAKNDFYVYHGAECAALSASGGLAGPGDYYAAIPADAIHLLSVPLTGTKISVGAQAVFQALSVPLAAGDCLVTLWGLAGSGGFDNETQVFALTDP